MVDDGLMVADIDKNDKEIGKLIMTNDGRQWFVMANNGEC